MAPIALMPHAVFVFLEAMRNWRGGQFHRRAPHVLQAQLTGRGKGLTFQEYSPEFPHVKGTLGFAGRPGGPAFYVSTVDNTRNHGPGSQGSKTEADSCFGRLADANSEAVVERRELQPGGKPPRQVRLGLPELHPDLGSSHTARENASDRSLRGRVSLRCRRLVCEETRRHARRPRAATAALLSRITQRHGHHGKRTRDRAPPARRGPRSSGAERDGMCAGITIPGVLGEEHVERAACASTRVTVPSQRLPFSVTPFSFLCSTPRWAKARAFSAVGAAGRHDRRRRRVPDDAWSGEVRAQPSARLSPRPSPPPSAPVRPPPPRPPPPRPPPPRPRRRPPRHVGDARAPRARVLEHVLLEEDELADQVVEQPAVAVVAPQRASCSFAREVQLHGPCSA